VVKVYASINKREKRLVNSLIVMSRGGPKDDMDMDTGGDTSNSQDMSKRQGLIAVNDLMYVLEPDLSVASNKTHKNHFFQQSEYSGGSNAICILNSGADYIDTRRSWLQFDVELTVDDVVPPTIAAPDNGVDHPENDVCHASFGAHGSACNLIQSILISTRSGDELAHLFEFGLMQNMLIPLAYGREWMDGPGKLMGMGGGIQNKDRGGFGEGGSKRFCIPMYCLAPLFGYGRLMPSMLMSGLRIEINFAEPAKAYQMVTSNRVTRFINNPVISRPVERKSSYKIKSPQFVLSSVQLSDSIQRALNELSATNGLEIVYTDYAHTNGGQSITSDINTEIRKSCSRALKAFARVRNVGYDTSKTLDWTRYNANDPTGKGMESSNDSFRAEQEFPFTEYQWQLGSLYFPQQPVTGAGNTDELKRKSCAVSSYAHLLEAVDKYQDNAAIFNTFTGVPTGGSKAGDDYYSQSTRLSYSGGDRETMHGFNGRQTTLAVTLERSTMFNLAGVPVNNSRVLALRAKLDPTITDLRSHYVTLEKDGRRSLNFKRDLHIFLKYVKLARVFLNNVEVEQ